MGAYLLTAIACILECVFCEEVGVYDATLVFEWTGSHDVWEFATEAAWESCDFSDAALLGDASGVAVTSAGTGFYGCGVGEFKSLEGDAIACAQCPADTFCVNNRKFDCPPLTSRHTCAGVGTTSGVSFAHAWKRASLPYLALAMSGPIDPFACA